MQRFLLRKRTIFFLDLPIMWHVSMSSAVTWTFAAFTKYIKNSWFQVVIRNTTRNTNLHVLSPAILFNWVALGFKTDYFLLQLIQSFNFILQIFNYIFFDLNYFISRSVRIFLKFSTNSSLRFESHLIF